MSDDAIDRILADIFPSEDHIFIEESQMPTDTRIEILNLLVTDLLETVSKLADELDKLKRSVSSDRDDSRRKSVK